MPLGRLHEKWEKEVGNTRFVPSFASLEYGQPSIRYPLAWHKMAENSSKNLLDTRSHVLQSSTPAKRYPLMGTQHITHKERFPSKMPKNTIFAPENTFSSAFSLVQRLSQFQ